MDLYFPSPLTHVLLLTLFPLFLFQSFARLPLQIIISHALSILVFIFLFAVQRATETRRLFKIDGFRSFLWSHIPSLFSHKYGWTFFVYQEI